MPRAMESTLIIEGSQLPWKKNYTFDITIFIVCEILGKFSEK